MAKEDEQNRDNRNSGNKGGYKPRNNNHQRRRPNNNNRSNNRNGNHNNDSRGGEKNNPPQEVAQHKSIKKEILRIINGDFKDDEIKLYALSSLFVGTQVEELTKAIKMLTKKMEDCD